MIKGLFLLVIFLSAQNGWSTEHEESYAVVVSSEDSYLKGEAKLEFAQNDADRLSEALERFSRIPRSHILRLINPTRNQFASAFAQLKKNSLKKFVFYYSGHSNELGLHFADGLVNKGELFDYFSSVPAKTKIIVFDSCFSGALKSKGVKKVDLVVPVSFAVDEPTGSVILTSSSSDEFSYESDKFRGSIFTYHLVTGLYGQADLNGDGLITIDELYSYTYLQTKHQSLVSGGKNQNPEFRNQLAGQGSLVIGYLEKQLSQIDLDKNIEGEVDLVNEGGAIYFRFNKSKGEENSLKVPRGAYRISVLTDSQEGQGHVDVTDRDVQVKSESLKWVRRVRPSVKIKGSLPQTLFGALFLNHPPFRKEERAGSSFEFQVMSPVLSEAILRWRFTTHFGSESHSLVANENEKLRYSRLTIGAEGGFTLIPGSDWEGVVGFRLGVLWSTINPTQNETSSLSNLSIGGRWHFDEKLKIDFLLGFDSIKREAIIDKTVPTLGIGLAF